MTVERDPSGGAASQGKVLPALVVIQVLIALAALALMAFVGAEIKPLLTEKAQLETDIAGYKGEVVSLQSALQAARSELDATKSRLLAEKAALETEIAGYRQDVAALQGELQRANDELAAAKAELEDTRQHLREALDLARYTRPIDFVDLKVIYSRYPGPARALERILELREQGVGWHLGGQDPAVGFDSPTFAAYILRELGLPGAGAAPADSLPGTSRRLFETLPPTDRPEVGDLVFYPAGYVLFQFADKDGNPVVVGMTPSGIAALAPDFARPLGYRKSGLGH